MGFLATQSQAKTSALQSHIRPLTPASELAAADRAALHRPLGQGNPLAILRQVLDPELPEEGAHVGLDRIDAELQLGGDAVKTHMRALFGKLGVEDLPQNRKRVALAERALQSGAIGRREL